MMLGRTAVLGWMLLALALAAAEPAREFTVGTARFTRGNLQVSLPGQTYATRFPCVWHGGKVPNEVEYDLDFPVTADYRIDVLYTAADSRPVDLLVDGRKVCTGMASVTGSWDTDRAAWETQGTVSLSAGAHTIRLERASAVPHLCALRFSSSVPFPADWTPPPSASPAAEWQGATNAITVMAPDYDRSNLQVSQPGEIYAGRYACIWNAQQYPNQAEYEIDFPVAGEYTLSVLYTAADSRPMDILLDGKKVHTGLASVTGDWNTNAAAWEKQCSLTLTAGVHTVRLERQECMPHLCALRFETAVAFPPGWQLRRPGLEERRAREAKEKRLRGGLAALELINPEAMERAVKHLAACFPQQFPSVAAAQEQIRAIVAQKEAAKAALGQGDEAALARVGEVQAAQRQLLGRNPLLAIERVLLVKRAANAPALGLPQNWQSNCCLPRSGYADEIAVLDPRAPEAPLTTLYRPAPAAFVGDVDLHAEADRLLFSSVAANGRWQIFEVRVDGSGLRQVTPGTEEDVDNYDGCYLPDDRILFTSTRAYVSVPCVNGSSRVANLFRMNADGTEIRQLCFDQEHNWCPTIMNDGRVLYTRWEYTDTPHTHSRLLFRMNPDGTQQMEYYGSNSYWPNAMFYTRPIPGSPTQVVTIVSGHHGVRRMGELVILDPQRGRHEADGAVQRIPGFGRKVEPLIEDNLVDNSWPKFLHPFPLGDAAQPEAAGRYFLVACQPSAESLWGIYLVDVFDNLVLLREEPGFALLEPLPLRPTPRPPVIPDKVDLKRREAIVQVTDVYRGPGLAGVPRGTVKRLRLFSYSFGYPDMGGPQGVVGMEGPWDIRRMLGTVPVAEDGSAHFRVPANTPIAVQPLDADGRAVQLMRSWFTGMPGEVVTCVGCHESQNTGSPNLRTLAAAREPEEIAPWRGPARGYSFAREVQPVLDQYCLGCHNGSPGTDGPGLVDLRGTVAITDYDSRYHFGGADAGRFSVGYANLQRFVRRPGLESDYHLLTPMEFHASTTELAQMLTTGHHGVVLGAEAWDRLNTWIDLNAPYHGSWLTIAGEARVRPPALRRREMLRQYANLDVDLEWLGPETSVEVQPVLPQSGPAPAAAPPRLEGWPFVPAEAVRRQKGAAAASERKIDLGDGLTVALVLVPGGRFVMGDVNGQPDEAPQAAVTVAPFWMARCEISNEQYARFDAQHDSRVEVRHAMQFGVQGWPLNRPQQPVVRVSWERAMAFCEWLSGKVGESFTLPTEAQWEYACRAGSDQPFAFGAAGSDFAPFANLADIKLRDAVSHPYMKENVPLPNPSKYDDWIPRDNRSNDGQLVSAPVGSYQPNVWGLHDMHGNVWEWTRSALAPYPYGEDDGRNARAAVGARVVRGGSWRDRPQRAHASTRLAYAPWQRVYNVGFRVVCPLDKAVTGTAPGSGTTAVAVAPR
jgi:formylglycine-generating enzyme required for sulfatase activity